MTLDLQLRDRPRPTLPPRWVRLAGLAAHPVAVTFALAAVLHVLWWWLFANSGGDIAAQDAWAEFARLHPGSAYNLAWYGGMHPVNYSILSPYVMALLGVRTTMMIAGTVSAALLALVIVRSRAVARPLWPALYGAVAITGNAVSGRVTFGLGIMFGLAAVAVVFTWPQRWRSTGPTQIKWLRVALAVTCSMLATASSPVAGLFLGMAAAALWLAGRRPAAYALGVPPIAVVAVSAWLFPFAGHQPMDWTSAILPVTMGVAVLLLAPEAWRSVRIASAVYVVGVIAAWAIPSPIGTNVTRLGLLFGGVVLVCIATSARPLSGPVRRWVSPGAVRVLLVAALTTSSIWQVAVPVRDALSTSAPAAWSSDIDPLINQLQTRRADLGRVEVVPTRSHREAAALTPYMNLARGWNRQADAERNPLFYNDDVALSADTYRAWLDRWAVRNVVLPASEPDGAAVQEAALVAGGLPYLREVWSDASWRLFEVVSPTPLVAAPAVVTRFDAIEVDVYLPRAATVLVRVPDSPWLSLVDADGRPVEPPVSTEDGTPAVNLDGCLSPLLLPATVDQPLDDWILLHAPRAGLYRIAAPYQLERGTTCPEE